MFFFKNGFIGTSLFWCNFSEIYIQIWISIQFWILKPILTYFSRKKIILGRKFYYFLVWKYELCLSKLKITKTMFSTFGLRILLPVQKCMNEMDFEKKDQNYCTLLKNGQWHVGDPCRLMQFIIIQILVSFYDDDIMPFLLRSVNIVCMTEDLVLSG